MDYTIDTIFYFVGTEAEYQRMRENISPKTIVFVQDSHEIYLNGWAYGKTSTNGLATTAEVGNLSDTIDSINERIGEVSDHLDQMVTDLDERIDDRVSDQLETADLLAKNAYLNGQIGVKLNEWKQQASIVTEDSVTWTNVTGNVDSLTQSVNKVIGNFNADGSFKPTQTLQSIIDNRIDGNQTIAQIAASWALLDDNENVLKWLASGFDAQTIAGNNSFAAMYSAGKNETTSAISALRTEVNTTLNGYVSAANLATQVTGVLNDKGLTAEAISGLASKSYVDGQVAAAETNIFARTLDGAGNQSVSDLLLQANRDHSSLAALTQWKDTTTFVTSTAGLQTEAGLDRAVAQLLASTTSESGVGVSGAMGVAISDGISTATITANQINLEGLVTANNNFKILSDGSIEAKNAKLSGSLETSTTKINNDGSFILKNPSDNFTIVQMDKTGVVSFQNGDIKMKVVGLNLDGSVVDPTQAESVITIKTRQSYGVYGGGNITKQTADGRIVGYLVLGDLENYPTIKERTILGSGRTGYPSADITDMTIYNDYGNFTFSASTNDSNGAPTSARNVTVGVRGTVAAKDIYIGSFHHPDQWSSIAGEARYHFTDSGLTVNGLSGISGTYQLGTYYVTFTDGIATRCETTAPSA